MRVRMNQGERIEKSHVLSKAAQQHKRKPSD